MKGNKPDFHSAMGGEQSEQFYNQFLQKMKDNYKADKIKSKSCVCASGEKFRLDPDYKPLPLPSQLGVQWWISCCRWSVWCRHASIHTE